jgi:pyridoxine 5-phosphate synthase
VRNARAGGRPGPRARPRLIDAAAAVVAAGAHGLTLHPRPDRRHATPEDVRDFAAWLAARPDAGVEFNVEGNPLHGEAPDYPGFLALCEESRPSQATLVPDARGQLTSDHGWTAADVDTLRPLVERLRAAGCRVSLFVDADPAAADAAADAGADRIELYTGPWADAFAAGRGDDALAPFVATAERARKRGLGVNAGHDLDRANLAPFLAAVGDVDEVSIGQALVADALEMGLGAATAAFLDVIAGAGR